MARHIAPDETGHVYRAVITITPHTREPYTKHEGPYGTAAAAQGRVTFWTNHYADRDEDDELTGTSRATGHIEQGKTVWEPVK
ncbi:hypothetical protein ACFQ61_02045 [Streptomyces sp. NPDC056500]|uniref:hypothetical protein n=1 Tax=Streptomyces sp. NPDC056500 TaxID=3345840 RepID=UPI003676BBFD